MVPVLYLFYFLLLITINVIIYIAAGLFFPAKRKYVVPLLILSFAWPVREMFWAHYIGDGLKPEYPGYRVFKGLLYTFDTRKPIAGFIYYNIGPHVHLPTLLAFCDILLASACFSLLIYGFSRAFNRR